MKQESRIATSHQKQLHAMYLQRNPEYVCIRDIYIYIQYMITHIMYICNIQNIYIYTHSVSYMCQKSRTHLAKIHSWQCLFESLNPWGYETIEVRNIVPHDLIDPSACTFMNRIYPDGRLEREKSPADRVFCCVFFFRIYEMKKEIVRKRSSVDSRPWCLQAVSVWSPKSPLGSSISEKSRRFCGFGHLLIESLLRFSPTVQQSFNLKTIKIIKGMVGVHMKPRKPKKLEVPPLKTLLASLRGCLEIRGPKF